MLQGCLRWLLSLLPVMQQLPQGSWQQSRQQTRLQRLQDSRCVFGSKQQDSRINQGLTRDVLRKPQAFAGTCYKGAVVHDVLVMISLQTVAGGLPTCISVSSCYMLLLLTGSAR